MSSQSILLKFVQSTSPKNGKAGGVTEVSRIPIVDMAVSLVGNALRTITHVRNRRHSVARSNAGFLSSVSRRQHSAIRSTLLSAVRCLCQ